MTSSQVDRLLTVFERMASVAERWATAEYPDKHEDEGEGQVYRAGHYDEANTREEYDAIPENSGRFERGLISKNPGA